MVDDFPEEMLDDFPDWAFVLEKVFLLCEDGNVPDYQYVPCIRRREDGEPKMTTEEEYNSFRKEVKDSEGFDISFEKYRCIFNYQPLNFDDNDFAIEPETTRELIDRLSKESLEIFNKNEDTSYEFVKVIKANLHSTAGVMYFITFEAKQPSDDEAKVFRAKVRYFYQFTTQYLYCYLKPEKKVHSIEAAEKEDPKKPRLTEEEEEPSNV